MANEKSSPPRDADNAPTSTLQVAVHWDGEQSLGPVAPAAVEVAGLLLGLEATYEALAGAFGYPPHFLKITSIQNPELKVGLEGGKEVIEAVRELLYAAPSLVANLFRPKAAWRRAKLEEQIRTKELEERAASADARRMAAEADTSESLARKIRADKEIAELRSLKEAQAIPIQADETAHAVLSDVVAAVADAHPSHRLTFIGDITRYAVVAHSFDARARVSLVPLRTPTRRPRSTQARYKKEPADSGMPKNLSVKGPLTR